MKASSIPLLAILLWFLMFSASVLGDPPGQCTKGHWNAGIMPFAKHEDEILLLLGHESKAERRYWLDFAGKKESYECIPAETAAREFAQESRRAYPISQTLSRIMEIPPSLQIKDTNTTIWVLEVEWIEAKDIESLDKVDDAEKTAYCWMKLRYVLNAVDNSERSFAQAPENCKNRNPLDHKIYDNLSRGQPLRVRLDELLSENSGSE